MRYETLQRQILDQVDATLREHFHVNGQLRFDRAPRKEATSRRTPRRTIGATWWIAFLTDPTREYVEVTIGHGE